MFGKGGKVRLEGSGGDGGASGKGDSSVLVDSRSEGEGEAAADALEVGGGDDGEFCSPLICIR